MITLNLSDQQIVDLVKQLPPVSKQSVLDALMSERALWWDMTLSKNEDKLRKLARQRGLDWNTMSEIERENFVDDLMHE
jgi:hypothetical protein